MAEIKHRSGGAFFKEQRIFPKRGPNGFPIGPRTKRRAEENAKLRSNPQIPRHCEIQIKGVCVNAIMLTWAHSKKSRFITTDKDWQEAARCCLPCHQYIEALSHKLMKKLVVAAIRKRDSRMQSA